MKIEVDEQTAAVAIQSQLKDFYEKAEAAYKLFLNGQHQQAYSMFPHHHEVGNNLETFVSAKS